MDRREVEALRKVLGSGSAMLFTGAGFSSAAEDAHGRSVPLTEEIKGELWQLCFPEEEQDDSTLTDLFHHAARHRPRELDALLRRRLVVRADTVPDFYERWFAVPWKRAWTLNVDDLEHAVATHFRLPRPVVSFSALSAPFSRRELATPALPFIHLNGEVNDGIRFVTFSTTQYGDRLARHDPWYQQFVRDLVEHPFVMVGTRLEEAPFWQSLHETFGADMDLQMEVCDAWIVAPRLSRARWALLLDLGIHWVPMSAEQFALEVLDPPIATAPESDRTAPRGL